MLKRIRKLPLCLVLALCLMSLPALAAEGDTVTLAADREIAETIVVSQNTTYDLAGFTLSLKADASGSVFHVKSGATLTVTDSSAGKTGKITGGKALNGDLYESDEYGFNRGEYRDDTDGCGGGVYVESGAQLVMTGVTITGNRAEQGGGVYLESGAELRVSGAASVTGNYNGASGSAADNVFLPLDASNNQSVITVDAALDADARIGVTPAIRTAEGEVTLTSGLKDKGTKNNFTSDEGKYIYRSASTGEAVYTATQRVHNHSFTYAASGDTITATCGEEDCALPRSQATIQIVKPARTVYGGSSSANATVERSSTDVAEPSVVYRSGEAVLGAAPTGAGTYTASITVGGATASVTYTIDKAAPTAAAPTGLTATYGQKLSEVALNNPAGNTLGKWTWADGNAYVGDVGSNTFEANFTPADTANYHAATNVDVSLNVGKAAAAEAMQAATVSLRAKSGRTATVSYTLPAGASYGDVTNSNTEFFTVSRSGGLVLTAAKDWTASDWAENTGKTFTVAVNNATNYNNYTLTVTVTPTFKNTQEITAANITAAYGGTSAKVSAATSGNGAISYAVKEGYGAYIDVNPSTGALTLKKAGTAYVAVTAAETDDYAAATKDVTVTVNRASLTVKAKDQSIYVGGTIPTPEGADFYTVTGLVGSDALTTPPTLAYQKEGVGITPVNTAAGTYDIVPSGANAGENYAITYQNGTLTVANRSSSDGGERTTVSVPVSGGKESVNVTVQVSGNTAAITGGNVDKVLTAEKVKTVTIDVSGINKDITAVSIPTETVKTVEKAVSDPSNDADALTVKLHEGSVTFDAKALTAIVDQAKGSMLRLELDSVGENMLNAAQKTAVDGLNVQGVLDVFVVSNGARISDFQGGRATVTVSYALKKGQTGRGVVVWYVAGNGEKTEVPSSYSNQTVSFTVGHFSNYVITYDAGRTNECPQDEACPISKFMDADATAWYHDGVHWALENGVMNGVSPKYFNPNGDTSRAMVVTMLWRMEGSPAQAGAAEFADVDGAQWYARAVRWANANGIVEGYRDANGKGQMFNPNGAVTREQLAAILYRYAQYKKADVSASANLSSYGDAQTVSGWATSAMQWAVGSGIINGIDGNLAPAGNATRAQVATMLMRYSTAK